jgi:PIN domain nuclease of toxin-antitoxin system
LVSLLLDTHTVLWWLAQMRLTDDVREEINDPGSSVFVSAATVWEVAIKVNLGKLETPESLVVAATEEGFQPLPISMEHAERAGSLPLHHKDPFDRLLIAQAQLDGLTIVTRDRAFDAYEVPVRRC